MAISATEQGECYEIATLQGVAHRKAEESMGKIRAPVG